MIPSRFLLLHCGLSVGALSVGALSLGTLSLGTLPACAPPASVPSVSTTGIVSGRVTLLDGDPVARVRIEAGAQTSETDEEGRFVLENVPAGTVSLFARAEETSTGHLRLAVTAGDTTEVTVQVLPVVVTELPDAAAGGTLVTEDGIVVVFPPGVVVDEDGDVVSGPVQFASALLDDPLEFAVAPGNLEASDGDGGSVQLKSNGMFEGRLSQDGRPLNVGSPVEVSWPSAGTALPGEEGYRLYGFDEALGKWVESGATTLVDGVISATVPHFSYWNRDLVASWMGCVEATLQYAGGSAVDTQVVGVWVSGGAHTNLTTDGDGRVSFAGPDGETAAFSFIYSDGTDTHYWTTPPSFVPLPDNGCLDLGELVENDGDYDNDGESAEPWGEDCNDADAAINPGATEIWANGLDENCDGNDCDEDGDGVCVEGYTYEVPAGMGIGDCDDQDATLGAGSGWYLDEDGDGYGAGTRVMGCVAPVGSYVAQGDDCEDLLPAVNPGMFESCGSVDGLDDDCNGETDPACGTGWMTFQVALAGASPDDRDCRGYWAQTWTATTDMCPDCTFGFEVTNVFDALNADLVDDGTCPFGDIPASWLLAYDPDEDDPSQGIFWVSYLGAWDPTWLDVGYAAGGFTWVHAEFSTWEQYQADGTWLTYWWAGSATP